MAFETHGIILFIIAGIELFLGLYVFIRNRRDGISTSFFMMVIGIVVWLLANAILASSLQGSLNEFYYRLAYFVGIPIATAFLSFAWVFPYKSANISKIIKAALLVVTLLSFILFLFSDLMIINAVNVGNASDITYGPIFSIYIVYFTVLFIWAFYVLLKKLMKAEGMHKWQLKLVIISMLIPFIVNVTTDIIMPWMGYPRDAWVVYVGAESSIVLVGLTSYIIFKKNI